MGCHGRGGRGERRAVVTPTRGARTPSAPPSPPLTPWRRHDRGRWSGGPSESPREGSSGALPAGGRARGWPERAQMTEPLSGRPGRLSRGPMAQPSCEWLEQRGESSGGRRGREGGGDAVRRGLLGGVYREEVLKGDYKEASTGDMVRHDGGRALSRRPAGLPEGPCSPRAQAPLSRAETQPGRCLGRHLEGAEPVA